MKNMPDQQYLEALLQEQSLADDSSELTDLQSTRAEVEALLRRHFGDSPKIAYGGSKAKGTMIRDSYDLDIICYFPRDDEDAGGTLEDIFNNVRDVLTQNYVVVVKTQAIRIMGKGDADFHVDVVPGRFIDDKKTDVFLYRATGDKTRLKTNLQVHIDHVRKSGLRDAIKLLKLWRGRCNIEIRTFVLELLAIKLLDGHKSKPLHEQLRHFYEEVAEKVSTVAVTDPANPDGNDLSDVFTQTIRAALGDKASSALVTIATLGWKGIFGELSRTNEYERLESLQSAARRVSAPTKPWCRDGL